MRSDEVGLVVHLENGRQQLYTTTGQRVAGVVEIRSGDAICKLATVEIVAQRYHDDGRLIACRGKPVHEKV